MAFHTTTHRVGTSGAHNAPVQFGTQPGRVGQEKPELKLHVPDNVDCSAADAATWSERCGPNVSYQQGHINYLWSEQGVNARKRFVASGVTPPTMSPGAGHAWNATRMSKDRAHLFDATVSAVNGAPHNTPFVADPKRDPSGGLGAAPFAGKHTVGDVAHLQETGRGVSQRIRQSINANATTIVVARAATVAPRHPNAAHAVQLGTTDKFIGTPVHGATTVPHMRFASVPTR